MKYKIEKVLESSDQTTLKHWNNVLFVLWDTTKLLNKCSEKVFIVISYIK